MSNEFCTASGYLYPFRTVDLRAPCPICGHPGVLMRKDGRFRMHIGFLPRSEWRELPSRRKQAADPET